ncbi:MAG TPA: type I pullulanase, partial [Deinococcales bacterium]|nr:type I pullulanase [Deinococcales bacterium]
NQPIQLLAGNQPPQTVYAREVLSERDYWYSGDDLGARYTPSATTFKVWSPVASTAELIVFDAATGGPRDTYDMERGPAGVWSLKVKGNLNGKYYQYRFNSYGDVHIAADINGYAASVDGTRSMVVDLAKTNPAGFAAQKPVTLASPTDAVLYEMHIRDFTVDPSSGVKPEWRGTYLGLAERGTTDPNTKLPTGLDYLVKLGVTDLHLMPFQKYNPTNPAPYNWGYETNLFNVPDPRYSTKPEDPAFTIGEVKQMVQAVHAAGIRVVMDVVYNHTMPASGEASAFDATVPYYYFRTNDAGGLLNESGVGNAVDDERPMVRKYIRDSLSYWVKEYKVDGFRFDLLGMFTKATVQDLATTLRGIRPDLLIYGEPWTGGGPTRFGKGQQRGLNVAVFNDDYRNALRGDLDTAKTGFVMGAPTPTVAIQKGLVGEFPFSGAISGFTDSPLETINYISAHDNLALWDKVTKAMPDAAPALQASAVKLSGAAVLLAQGIPFLEGGVEMGRTKGGNNNSYNAGDAVNRFDWDRGAQYKPVTDYYAGLIALRKAHPAFRLNNPVQVRSALQFLDAAGLPAGTVAFTLNGAAAGDSWRNILVVLHGSTSAGTLKLPEGNWTVAVNGQTAGNASLGTVSGSLTLDPLAAYVLYK